MYIVVVSGSERGWGDGGESRGQASKIGGASARKRAGERTTKHSMEVSEKERTKEGVARKKGARNMT